MTRYTNIVNVLDLVYITIQEWIQKEITDNGLLSDVEDFIVTAQNERPLKTPSIWMQKHNWKPIEEQSINSNYATMTVQFPVEFDCIEYANDLEEGEQRANNLVGRVIQSILRHYDRRQIKGVFNFVGLEIDEGYPNGGISINGKQEVIPVAGVLLIFKVSFIWNTCIVTDDAGNSNLDDAVKNKEISIQKNMFQSPNLDGTVDSVTFKDSVLDDN